MFFDISDKDREKYRKMEKNKDEVKRITTKQHGLGRKRGRWMEERWIAAV